mgnify:CR=1 FL=1
MINNDLICNIFEREIYDLDWAMVRAGQIVGRTHLGRGSLGPSRKDFRSVIAQLL